MKASRPKPIRRKVVSPTNQLGGMSTTPLTKMPPASRTYPSQLVAMLREKIRVMVPLERPNRE